MKSEASPGSPGDATTETATRTATSTRHRAGACLNPNGADRPLSVPRLDADVDALTAALAYADCGWYVLPVRRGSKHPGSVVGTHWQHKSSRDPQQIVAWFAGTDYGIALHCGRSGAVVLDVDKPEKVPDVLRDHLGDGEPYQATRPDTEPGRGHYVFGQPPGRVIGNGTGRLGGSWGDVRGLNGVIVVAPNGDDGRRWERTGPVPVLPDELAELLDDASPATDAASDAVVAAFLQQYSCAARPELLAGLVKALAARYAVGESRHQATVSVTVGAMKEARTGYYPAQQAAEVIKALFLAEVAKQPAPGSKQGAPRTGAAAESEWAGILSWAVGQALAADPDETRTPVDDKTADRHDWMSRIASPNGQAAVKNLDDGGGFAVTTISDVSPEQVSWLWPGRLPAGKLVTLDGDPGVGKSTLALTIAAAVTTAGAWPDNTCCEDPGDVILLSAEDGLADTIRPRLDAAGADVTRVHAVQGVPLDATGEALRMATLADVDRLRRLVDDTGARLVIVDVLMAYVPTGTDSHRDQDMRQVLARLSALADATGCTILLLRHLNKGKGDPLYRGGGSIGIVGAARVGMLVAPDPEDDAQRVLASVKNNLAPAPESLTYRLTPDGPYGVARIEWTGVSGHDARALLSDDGMAADTATDEARDWLEDYLTEQGCCASADAKAAGRKAGFSERTVKRAASKLNVTAESAGFPRRTYWRLPDASQATNPSAGPTGPTGDDLQEREIPSGPTGRQSGQSGQSGQAFEPGPTAAPPCVHCGEPVAAGQRDDAGRPAHLSCQQTGLLNDPVRPDGPGRCPDCGFHVPTMGHRDPCIGGAGRADG